MCLGAGLVEAVANSTLTAIRDGQPPNMRGLAMTVPILERPGQTRIGRFGWKAQHGPPVVRGRRVLERDGHHQSAPAHRKHGVGP